MITQLTGAAFILLSNTADPERRCKFAAERIASGQRDYFGENPSERLFETGRNAKDICNQAHQLLCSRAIRSFSVAIIRLQLPADSQINSYAYTIVACSAQYPNGIPDKPVRGPFTPDPSRI
jgi:hypothetical protein